MKKIFITLSLALTLSLVSCDGNENKHELTGGVNLEVVSADKNLNASQKADQMMLAVNVVLRKVAVIEDDKKASELLEQFIQENATPLNNITLEFGTWSETASQEDLLAYVRDLQSKDYYSELDSNLSIIGIRMTKSPELEKSMESLMKLINPPS